MLTLFIHGPFRRGGKPNKSPSDPNNNFDGREFLHLSDVQHVREYLFILVKNMSLYQVTKWTTPPRQYFRYTARQKSRNPFAWSSFVVVIKIQSSSMHTEFFFSKESWRCTVILKCPLFLVPFPYEVNSTKFACKSVPLSKPKPIPIVFIWLREGPLWPTFVHAQGPQLFVSKPDWHATSVVVK